MKKTLLTSVLSVLAVAGANAMDINPYVSAKFGYSRFYSERFLTRPAESVNINKAQTSEALLGAGVSFGVDPFASIRLEAEYVYSHTQLQQILIVSSNDIERTSLSIPTNKFFANAYLDLGDKSFVVKPYIGFGAGIANGSLREGDFEEKFKGFTWMGTVGATYSFNDNISVDLGVRYSQMRAKNIKFGSPIDDAEITIHPLTISLGAKYKF